MTTQADLELHMASLPDDALVRLIDLEWRDDEAQALELAREELARRRLPQAERAKLSLEATEAVRLETLEREPPPIEERIVEHLLLKPLILLSVVAWPLLIFAARKIEDPRRAKKFRFLASLGALAWVMGAVALLLSASTSR